MEAFHIYFHHPGTARFSPIYQTQLLGFKYCRLSFLSNFIYVSPPTAVIFCPKFQKSNFSGAGIFRRPAGGKCDRWFSDKAPSAPLLITIVPVLWSFTTVAKYFRWKSLLALIQERKVNKVKVCSWPGTSSHEMCIGSRMS